MNAIEDSLNDAEVLANYAVRNNITGVQEAINGIATAREHCAAGNLKGDQQRAFYADYSTLASAVAPVSVSSLKDSLDEYGVRVQLWFGLGGSRILSRAGIAARRKAFFATLALFLLIFFQSYWLIGNTLLLAFQKPTPEEVETMTRLSLFYAQNPPGRAQTGPVQPAPVQPGSVQPPHNADSNNAVDREESDKAVFDEEAKRQAQRIEIGRAQQRRTEIAEMLASWARFLFFPVHLEPDPHQDTDAAADRVVTICGRILDVLQQYVLPLLYGLLGAMAYVIRTVSQQARDRLYRAESETVYDLRIWLGILGGLAIGWFFKPGSDAAGSISPLALAFVAGYSVDLLFAAMDRIVSAFSAPEKKQEATEPAVRKR